MLMSINLKRSYHENVSRLNVCFLNWLAVLATELELNGVFELLNDDGGCMEFNWIVSLDNNREKTN